MIIFHAIIYLTLIFMGLIFKKKKIKDIKIFNLSVPYTILLTWLLVVVIVDYVIPLPTYYIKDKNEKYIENVIETEMTNSNIIYDKDTVKVVDQFIGKFNQLYFCSYEVDGKEEARMFDFKANIFGDLKPKYDFSKSKVILKDEIDDGMNFRRFGDDISAFHTAYGYANNPEVLANKTFGNFVVKSINLESYYLYTERIDAWSPLALKLLIYGSIALIHLVRETKQISSTDIKYFGKKKHKIVLERYV